MNSLPKKREVRKKHNRRSILRNEEKYAYMFIIIPLLIFLAFRILPTLFSLFISFTNWTLLNPEKSLVGLENYITIFKNEDFQKALVNTFIYILVSCPFMVVISMIIALLLNNIKKGIAFFRTLVFIPYITSAVAVSFIWRWMFMQNGGIINSIIMSLGIPQQPFLNSPHQAIFVIISNVIWLKIGFNTIILLAGLKQISETYYEAAEIDGANGWNKFWFITIPELNPALVYITVMGTISTLQVFTQILNITVSSGDLGGPLKSTTSIVLEIYLKAFRQYQMGEASAMTVILFIIIMLITLLQMKVLNNEKA